MAPSGVVADQRDPLVQVEGREELDHQASQTGRRQIGVSVHRRAVGSERPVGSEAAVAGGQCRDDVPPHVGVGEHAVHEHDRFAGAALPERDRARRKLDHLLAAEVL
jgi:hypothetical protein